MDYQELFDYLGEAGKRVLSFLRSSDVKAHFNPEDMSDAVLDYVERGGKRLRPAVLLMSAGALGGPERERLALPAAAGVELFHTWTLVHDDLIDNDSLRRGGPTVHEAVAAAAREKRSLPADLAKEYGRDVAILAGDVQHGWSIACFVDCALQPEVDSLLGLKLIRHLQSYVLGNLIYGEVLDVQYGMQELAELENVDETKIVEMLWLKTGILYEFSAMAGAMIGKNTPDFEDESVRALAQFASKCGTAFQLQDDILGVLGDEAALGKPIGSDIREGKKTVIVHEALKNASDSQRRTILATLGNRSATDDEVRTVTGLFGELNGIGRTQELATRYIEEALPHLDVMPESRYKDLLLLWAHYMLDRKF